MASCVSSVCADEIQPQVEDAHFVLHTTYIWQKKPAFAAQPNAINPLNNVETNRSLNVVAHLATRVWTGGELYFNVEIEKSVPFRGMVDVGGPTNGEDAAHQGRTTLFFPRLFLRQVWGNGGGVMAADAGENQLAGSIDKNRLVLTAGHFSVVDIFGKNRYTFDPSLHFMNWSNTTHAAYDYAADAHGYSWGVAAEWYQDDWVLRLGRVAVPAQLGSFSLDSNVLRHYGDQLEVQHLHHLSDQEGKVRLLLWRNRAVMAAFQDALNDGLLHQRVANVANVRVGDRVKQGIGLDIEQALSDNLGAFFRVMQSDGRSETLSYLEVDESISTGIALQGGHWNRSMDTLGVSLKRNALSKDRLSYLQAGGVSVFNTQGSFQYRPEWIFETYYNWQFAENAWLTLDYQHVANPSYNAYRGPVQVYGLRLHLEY